MPITEDVTVFLCWYRGWKKDQEDIGFIRICSPSAYTVWQILWDLILDNENLLSLKAETQQHPLFTVEKL